MDSYKSIGSPGFDEYKEKKSKFLSFAVRCETIEQVEEELTQIKASYHDARHVCWAYRIGIGDKAQERCNDDGEPSSTAGKPILGQIHSFDLLNVLVVVVRYFGGIKLGTGGLIIAYRTAARLALEAAEIEEIELKRLIKIAYPFDQINVVARVVKTNNAELKQMNSSLEGYECLYEIKEADYGAFMTDLKALYFAKAEEIE